MEKCRQVLSVVIIFGGTVALLWLMLVLAAAVPNDMIRDNMLRSAVSYKDKPAYTFEDGGRLYKAGDNYADVILLNVSWNMGNGSPFQASLDTGYYDGGDMGESVGFYQAVSDRTVQPNTDYTRYWHGSAVFVRLLHLVTDVDGIKRIGAGAVLALALATMWMLVRCGHCGLSCALVLSMVSVQLWNIRLSMEYQPCFVICFLLCPCYLWAERRDDRLLLHLSVVGGACTAFFDFLTTETVTLLLPLLLVAAVRAEEGRLDRFGKMIRLYAKCGLCWVASYGGAFVVKWTAASLATGENKYAAAFSSVGERIGGSLMGVGPSNPVARIPAAVAANLTVMFGGRGCVEPMRVFFGLTASIMVLGSVWYLFHKRKADTDAVKLLSVTGLVVFVRFMALNNHSYLHEFFTYRALLCPVFAAFACLALTVEPALLKRKGKPG